MCCRSGIIGVKLIKFKFFLIVCIEWKSVCCSLLFLGCSFNLMSVCLLDL